MSDQELEAENEKLREENKRCKERIQDLENKLGKVSHVDIPEYGDEVQALPTIELEVDGEVYYAPGDKGRVSKNNYTTKSDGIDRFEVAWYRSGLVSTMKTAMWTKNFKFLAVGRLPVIGDEVEVLPGVDFTHDGEEFYKSNDRGRVCGDSKKSESDGIERFEVAWYRTGKVSTMKTDMWVRNFKFVMDMTDQLSLKEQALKNFFEKLDIDGDGTITREEFDQALQKGVLTQCFEQKGTINLDPKIGDEMEALPGISLVASGKDYYKEGDRGRVSKETYVTEADGVKRFEITWYRTGLVSTMKLDAWLKNFKYIGKALKVPTLGDEVLALSTAELVVEGQEYYKPGDKGRVCKDEFVAKDGVKKIEISWYRTGLISTMKTDVWFKYFSVVDNTEEIKTIEELKGEIAGLKKKLESGGGGYTQGKRVNPELGDVMEALPTVELVVGDKEYYVGGDVGQVNRETYIDEKDNVQRFEVTWYRTGLVSTMRLDAWLKNFKFLRKTPKLPTLGDELLCLGQGELTVDDKEYYKPGDKGRVSKEQYTSTDDGIDRFEVTWYRTGLTSTMKCNVWLKYFQILSGGDEDALVEEDIQQIIDRAVSSTSVPHGKPITLITGHPKQSAMGLFHFMRVKDPFSETGTDKMEEEIRNFVSRIKDHAALVTLLQTAQQQTTEITNVYGEDRITEAKEEINYFRGVARLKDDASALAVAKKIEEDVLDNLIYILYKKVNSIYVDGPNAWRDEGRDSNMVFEDFMKADEVQDAELTRGHVAALRLYTTPAFKYINQPLRTQEVFYDKNKPHPLPITVAYIAEGIKRLRAAYAVKVEAKKRKQVLTLWRGLKSMEMKNEFLENQRGGTELAPMSTTTDIKVAAKYAGSENSILFKIQLDNFMQYGAELRWLSAFPGEDEVLYPPLTYLQPTKRKAQRLVLSNGMVFQVYEVKPTIP